MSSLDEWCASVESMLRCLTAVTPDMGDRSFSRMLDILSGGASNPGSIDPAGEWFRAADDEPPGYIFIGPQGGDHHFQTAAPPGIDPRSMRVMPKGPTGRLWREIEAARTSASLVASGEKTAIEGEGGRLIAACDEADRPMMGALSQLLATGLLLRDPDADNVLLRQSAATYLQAPGADPATRVRDAVAQIQTLRSSSFLAGAPIWAVATLRQEALKRIATSDGGPALAAKLFDVSGVLSRPEEALRQGVSDLAYARQGEVVMAVCDAALDQAETAVESALDAKTILSHQTGLYAAAGWAYLGMRIAEVMLGQVAPGLWPDGCNAQILNGYVTKTEEIVVRAQGALSVACINAGSRQAVHVHRAQVAADGPARADELIDDYWYYPRAAKASLLS